MYNTTSIWLLNCNKKLYQVCSHHTMPRRAWHERLPDWPGQADLTVRQLILMVKLSHQAGDFSLSLFLIAMSVPPPSAKWCPFSGHRDINWLRSIKISSLNIFIRIRNQQRETVKSFPSCHFLSMASKQHISFLLALQNQEVVHVKLEDWVKEFQHR